MSSGVCSGNVQGRGLAVWVQFAVQEFLAGTAESSIAWSLPAVEILPPVSESAASDSLF